MSKLYAVAAEQKSNQQEAREAVKRHRRKPEPIVNIHDRDDPAPTLPVDDILRRSEGDHLGKR